MRNKILITTMASLIIILALSACGGSSEATNNEGLSSDLTISENESSSKDESNPGLGAEFENALPISSQLGFGTLLLEDTEYGVGPAQAAELLPLWKAARSLSESETVAEAEMDAVFNQIEDAMTSEQIAAIVDLQLTGEEIAQLMEELGISFGSGEGRGFDNMTPEQQATAQAARESGEGFPGGGNPGGGGGFLGGNPGGGGFQQEGGEQLTPEQQATIEARRAERGNIGARFALIFADPLIELLEGRAAE